MRYGQADWVRKEFEEAIEDGDYETARAIAKANPDLGLVVGILADKQDGAT